MWTTLNFKVRSKTKIMARNIYNRIIYNEFERDWLVDLGPALGDEKKKIKKKFFSSFRNFPGKIYSVMLWVSNVL